MPTTSPTASMEEYLEAIYNIASEGKPAIGARLAQQLGVSPPSVTGMVQRLLRQGLVCIGERKEIALTPRGEELAQTMVRRHRLAERLLTDILGIEWYRSHVEACRFEHAISPLVESRLAEVLGQPAACPHGNPIPGQKAARTYRSALLTTALAGDQVMVERISEEAELDAELLEFLDRCGVRPGALLHVVEVASYNATVTVRTDSTDSVLGFPVASMVWVRPVPHSPADGH